MENPSIEVVDLAVEMQDRILDLQWPWIEDLPVTDEVREVIFQHLCILTGRLLDATIYPDKFNDLMQPDL